MKTVGIICEYNPFHLGHEKQIRQIRRRMGEDCGIVCLMSGNFVQRGAPAVFDKSSRAQAAILCGADLVLELPVTYALSSAEGFAAGGVKILSGFCDYLCFGGETATEETLLATASALLSADFSGALRLELDKGLSFPAARQAALESMELDASLLSNPNDILAVEYCKAILSQNSPLKPMPIHRAGSYHASCPDKENPSAAAIRKCIADGADYLPYVPENVQALFSHAPIHTLSAGERAILGKLRTMTDDEFETLPYGSEGLWRKFMHACRSHATLEEIVTATKSKRYTRTRIDRMVICAFLGITKETLTKDVDFVRVLGFSEKGRTILKKARKNGAFPHIGEKVAHPDSVLEQRCENLYGLFCQNAPASAGQDAKRRVFIPKE